MKNLKRTHGVSRSIFLAITSFTLIGSAIAAGDELKEYSDADAVTLTAIRSPYLHFTGQERAFARVWLVDNKFRKTPIFSEPLKVSPGHHDLGILMWAKRSGAFANYSYEYSCVSLETRPNASYSFATIVQKENDGFQLRVTEELNNEKNVVQELTGVPAPEWHDNQDVVVILSQCKK